jgi:hypothetical protein
MPLGAHRHGAVPAPLSRAGCLKFSGKEPPSEHERDAILASVAARNGVTGAWMRDLSLQRDQHELDPKRMWFGEVNYFWPN